MIFKNKRQYRNTLLHLAGSLLNDDQLFDTPNEIKKVAYEITLNHSNNLEILNYSSNPYSYKGDIPDTTDPQEIFRLYAYHAFETDLLVATDKILNHQQKDINHD